jgi:hypothetical protein
MAIATAPYWTANKPELIAEWERLYVDEGLDGAVLLDELRKHPSYDKYFPGIKRDDGSIRITEGEYLSVMEGYKQALISVGLNPRIFADSFPNLVANDVNVTEFVDRLEAVREGVIDRAPAVAAYYSEKYGIDMTEEAIYASLLDPTVGEGIINRTIAISQVGAAAAEHGFDIALTAAEELVNRDLDIFAARRFFGEAEAMIPALTVLTARHNDPDDDFDLAEFTQAQIMQDPEQRRRIRRLLAQERTDFSSGSGTGASLSRSDAGALTGLAER